MLLSPHLDDVALSCFGALAGGVAATVFTASPARPGVLSAWDADCGASSSRDLMAARRAEDEAAAALAGATARHLGFAEQHHRDEPLDVAALTAGLADLTAGAAEVWVPAAVYGNPDHATVRSAAFAALARAAVPSVWLYAEYPYHVYLTRSGEDLASWFARRVPSADPEPVVRTLTGGELARKRAAVSCYASQLGPLDRTLGGRLLDDDLLGVEYAWRVRRG
ncbi:PIG-L family deacetylase [Spirilliplanes yamanashiensis]|uniref:Uncharacterized protein n=1 Tax=Spirilliplanes yamanashiensis TaxID=42233 RepID=A0A8J3Y4E0_9ACTN|nr:PIG-L family deacetylase [Spirilliplanes yamanashiensis]MDP9820003.1 LmbE family N-acetylglucosaminyl deacetylase [Spirilliplanes yamanashiensis]GIJ01178.1 hypothetical protein Sya03_05300 [Spirilliplanes yamanashiensis]